MIFYKRRKILSKVFRLKGSVFPQAFSIALPCSVITAGVHFAFTHRLFMLSSDEEPEDAADAPGGEQLMSNSSVWSGFTFLIGFLIVFRTSQAYQRFWDGISATHRMRVNLVNACSVIVSSSRFAKDPESTRDFQQLLVRLVSMLHAAALATIEDNNDESVETVEAFKYPLLDARGIDRESLQSFMGATDKVELVVQWIQQLLVEHVEAGTLPIPDPLLANMFQTINCGVLAFHDALKVASVPFPFPYSQMCDILLLTHWLCTPFVTAQWVVSPWWAALFSFLQVFVYWGLNIIATEIENPFGQDPNDIDGEFLQVEMNRHLLAMLDPGSQRSPKLRSGRTTANMSSMVEAWKQDAEEAQTRFIPMPHVRPLKFLLRQADHAVHSSRRSATIRAALSKTSLDVAILHRKESGLTDSSSLRDSSSFFKSAGEFPSLAESKSSKSEADVDLLHLAKDLEAAVSEDEAETKPSEELEEGRDRERRQPTPPSQDAEGDPPPEQGIEAEEEQVVAEEVGPDGRSRSPSVCSAGAGSCDSCESSFFARQPPSCGRADFGVAAAPDRPSRFGAVLGARGASRFSATLR